MHCCSGGRPLAGRRDVDGFWFGAGGISMFVFKQCTLLGLFIVLSPRTGHL